MREHVFHRVKDVARYYVNSNSTVREVAKEFGISKSTAHEDIKNRLKFVDYNLYEQANSIINKNKNERHLRGGIATKLKYLKEGIEYDEVI